VLNPQAILVVDDDDLLAGMVAELLTREGYRVWTARNGLQGYASYYQHEAQTVLTDIEMPQLNGFEMMRCIRAINASARTIYMSGAPEQYRRILEKEAQRFGAGVLRKPFAGTDLLKLISSSAEKMKPASPRSPDQKKACLEIGGIT
jgi:chemosensory pili system protein ChpA (sensor histidine kinase/response regulator)